MIGTCIGSFLTSDCIPVHALCQVASWLWREASIAETSKHDIVVFTHGQGLRAGTCGCTGSQLDPVRTFDRSRERERERETVEESDTHG